MGQDGASKGKQGNKGKQDKKGEEEDQNTIKMSKAARALLSWERERWHLRQKNKDPQATEPSKNKLFRMTPVDQKVLDHINKLKLGRRRGLQPITSSQRKNQFKEIRTDVDKIWEKKLTFVGGATAMESFLPESLPEIAFIGRSNVGKSSLINVLTSQHQVRVSDTPGETRQINWYRLSNHVMLVDLPGYGFAYASEERIKEWTELMCNFLVQRKALKRICVLIDSRHGLKPADIQFIEMLDKAKQKYQIVMTKADLVTPLDLARRHYLVQEELKNKYCALERIMMVSAWNATGIKALRAELANLMAEVRKPPRSSESPLPDYESYEPLESTARPARATTQPATFGRTKKRSATASAHQDATNKKRGLTAKGRSLRAKRGPPPRRKK